jgi:hypothetical protein
VENPNWISRLVSAFGDVSPEERDQITACYREWLRLKETKLGRLARVLLPSAVDEKEAAVRQADPSQKRSIWLSDALHGRLEPLDQQAAAWAEYVLRGGRLSDEQREAAEQTREQVRGILGEAVATIPEKPTQDSLRLLASEVLQDIRFALNNGEGPMSFRLGHIARAVSREDE